VRRVRIHDLRHAAATYLFAEGVDLKVVQATLRHTRLSTTSDIYTHVLEEVQRGAADSMDTVLGDLTQAKPTAKRAAAKKRGKAA
jgi:integrase